MTRAWLSFNLLWKPAGAKPGMEVSTVYIGCACPLSTVHLCMICQTVTCSLFFALLTSNFLHGFSTTKQNVAGWLEARKVEGSWTCLRHIAPCFQVKMCCSAQGNWIRVDWGFCRKWACSADATVKGICTTMIVLQEDFRSDQRLSSMEHTPPLKSVKSSILVANTLRPLVLKSPGLRCMRSSAKSIVLDVCNRLAEVKNGFLWHFRRESRTQTSGRALEGHVQQF